MGTICYFDNRVKWLMEENSLDLFCFDLVIFERIQRMVEYGSNVVGYFWRLRLFYLYITQLTVHWYNIIRYMIFEDIDLQ